MHGFGSWFEVEFGSIPDGHDYSPVTLSTSPWKPYVTEHAQLSLGSILKLHALSCFDQSSRSLVETEYMLSLVSTLELYALSYSTSLLAEARVH